MPHSIISIAIGLYLECYLQAWKKDAEVLVAIIHVIDCQIESKHDYYTNAKSKLP